MTKFNKEMLIFEDKLKKEKQLYIDKLTVMVSNKNTENGDKYVLYTTYYKDIGKYIIQYGVTTWDSPTVAVYITKYRDRSDIIRWNFSNTIENYISSEDFDNNTTIDLAMVRKLTKESKTYTKTKADAQSRLDNRPKSNEDIIKTNDERLKKLRKQLKEL